MVQAGMLAERGMTVYCFGFCTKKEYYEQNETEFKTLVRRQEQHK